MSKFDFAGSLKKTLSNGSLRRRGSKRRQQQRTQPILEQLEPRTLLTAVVADLDTGGITAQDLAQSLVGAGVSISNVVFTGDLRGGGSFSNGFSDGLGIDSGVILSSGRVIDAPGPNNDDDTTTILGEPGDADLTSLASADTLDASILEFDFIPTEDTLSFTYLFASEEYPESAPPNDSSFNDVFGFFLDGVNIAMLPNSTDAVSINNVNAVTNSQFFNNNTRDGSGNSPFGTEYDGFTRTFSAVASVTPGVTAHIKLGVADAGDSVLDSTVFIQAGSFVALPVVSIATTDPDAAENPLDTGEYTISRTGSTTNPLTVFFTAGGTAGAGDYAALPASVTIPAGASATTLVVTPVNDDDEEPDETVELTLSPNAAYAIDAGQDIGTVTITSEDVNLPPQPIIAAKVRVRLTDADYLQLAEVQVFETSTGTNLALGGTATQSSQQYANSGPATAIDDDTTSNRPSVAITREQFGAWWEVDLGGEFDVSQITVFNRPTSGRRLEAAVVEALDIVGNVVWSGTITDAADGSIHDFGGLSGPADIMSPTADLGDPMNGGSINPGTLNSRGYLDVAFNDLGGSGMDRSTIDGDEISISGPGVGTATLNGTAMLVSGLTYRYGFTGSFVSGPVDVNFASGTWQDNAGNANAAETESFTVSTPAPGDVARVRVRVTKKEYLQLAEVQVFDANTGANLALTGTTSQSSQLYLDSGPAAAADGDSTSNRPSVAITRQQSGAWWEVDLGGLFAIDSISVHNRPTSGVRLQGAIVEALDAVGNVVWSRTITGATDGSVHHFAAPSPPPVAPLTTANAVAVLPAAPSQERKTLFASEEPSDQQTLQADENDAELFDLDNSFGNVQDWLSAI